MVPASSPADTEAVRDVLHRYCRLLDARDIQRLVEGVYDVDGVDDRQRGTPRRGHQEIRQYFERSLPMLEATAHLLMNVEIELDGDRATTRSRVMACHWFADTAQVGKARPSECVLVGTYDDQLQRLPQGWRIVHRQVGALGPAGLLMGSLPEAFRGFGGVES
jgi:ketosteroid isomerase-like protein